MNSDKIELLIKLKESFQAQIENISVAEKALEDKFLKSQTLYNQNKQNNLFSEQILESLKMTLEFDKQQLEEFRLNSKEVEKKYLALLTMVEVSINELIEI
jgi:hypothetical protein